MKEIEKQIQKLIEVAILEDIGRGDLISKACLDDSTLATGNLILKQAGTIAGLPYFKQLFQTINPKIEVITHVAEGSYHKSGTVLAQVSGPAASILAGERAALNLIQHASGIATITAAFVKKVSGLKCAILDTRRTLPGLRAVEKYAVRVGGGVNYCHSLEDRCLIKVNHLAYFQAETELPILEVVKRVQAEKPTLPIEIEVENEEQLTQALQTDVSTIVLRKITPDKLKKCVNRIHQVKKKAYIESFGTITLETVRHYAETGVDGILIGDITHSVQALNMRFKLSPPS